MRRRLLLFFTIAIFSCALVLALVIYQFQQGELERITQALAQQAASTLAERVNDSIFTLRRARDLWVARQQRITAFAPKVGPRDKKLFDEFRLDLLHAVLDGAITDSGPSTVLALIVANHDGTIAMARADTGDGDDALSQYVDQPLSSLLPDFTPPDTFGNDTVVGIRWRLAAQLITALHATSQESASTNSPPRLIGVAIPAIVPENDETRRSSQWIIGLFAWRPFADVIKRSDDLVKALGYQSGYSYVIDSDADTVIAHRRPDFIGTSMLHFHHLPAVSKAVHSGSAQHVTYTLAGDSSDKTAYITNLRDFNQAVPSELAWTVGTGVQRGDLLAPVFTYLGVFAVLLFIAALAGFRFFRVSEAELIQQLNNAAIDDSLVSNNRRHALEDSPYSERLETALNAFIDRVKHKHAEAAERDFKVIDNPYVVGSPLHTQEVFFDRRDDVLWARTHLDAPGNELLAFIGARRIGKTSLLHRLKHQCIGGSRAFISAQRLLPSIRSDDSFFCLLGETIADELQDQTDDTRFLALFRDARNARDLSGAFKALPAALRPLVLLIDELQTIERCMSQGTMSDAPLVWLAGELESADIQVSIVTTGSSEWTRRRKSAWRVLHPRMVERRVSFLPLADVLDLVTKPVPSIHFSRTATEDIVAFTGGHPYLTQDTCFRIVRWLNAHRSYRVTSDVVSTIIREVEEDPPHVLVETWRGLGAASRTVLSVCAALIQVSTKTIAFPVLVRSMPAIGGHALSMDRLRKVVEGLAAEDILVFRQRESVGFRCDIWRRWLRRYQPAPGVEVEEAVYDQ